MQMTRSFSVSSMTFSTPPWVYSIFLATFLSSVQSQTMFVTVVSKRTFPPWSVMYLHIGRIMDSYWL